VCVEPVDVTTSDSGAECDGDADFSARRMAVRRWVRRAHAVGVALERVVTAARDGGLLRPDVAERYLMSCTYSRPTVRTADTSVDVKKVQIKVLKNVKNVKNVTIFLKMFVNVIKNVTSSWCCSAPHLMPKKLPPKNHRSILLLLF